VVEKPSGVVLAAEPPRKIGQASVDAKGRLKLPADFAEFLKKRGVKNVFITTVDMRLARLYAIAEWNVNENFFASASELSEEAEDIAYLARYYGDDSEIDEQGRVLVPQTLRKLLGIEGQPVFLDWHKGRINIAGKNIHEERMKRAEVGLVDKVKKLEKAGML
jgi:MraZ protein